MEFKEKLPIYQQIAQFICENILAGQWKEGERIPSVREMAVKIEVNPNTVMRTYTHLEEKKIIENKRGIGFFVSENGVEMTKEIKRENFLKFEIKEFFKTVEMLDMSFEDILILYNQYKKENEGRNEENK